MSALYPYASGNTLNEATNYSYAPYHGAAFFAAWREARATACGTHAGAEETLTACETFEIFTRMKHALLQAEDDVPLRSSLDAILRNFEAKKRIYAAYNKGFTSKGRSDDGVLELYVCFAEILDVAYTKYAALPYLNGLLKLVDMLCALAAKLSARQAERLAVLIEAEHAHVAACAAALGVVL
jgi:hypothetical protein